MPLLIPPPRTRLQLPQLRIRLILADDLPAEIHKRLIDIGSPSRGRLVIRGVAPALGDGERAGPRDGTVILEIGFVADDDKGDALVVFDADDLLAELVEFVEGAEACDGENEEEALAGLHVEFSAFQTGVRD